MLTNEVLGQRLHHGWQFLRRHIGECGTADLFGAIARQGSPLDNDIAEIDNIQRIRRRRSLGQSHRSGPQHEKQNLTFHMLR